MEPVSGLGSGSILCFSKKKLKADVSHPASSFKERSRCKYKQLVGLILSSCLYQYLEFGLLPYSGSLMNAEFKRTIWLSDATSYMTRKNFSGNETPGKKMIPVATRSCAWASRNNFDPILRHCSMTLDNNYYYKDCFQILISILINSFVGMIVHSMNIEFWGTQSTSENLWFP